MYVHVFIVPDEPTFAPIPSPPVPLPSESPSVTPSVGTPTPPGATPATSSQITTTIGSPSPATSNSDIIIISFNSQSYVV